MTYANVAEFISDMADYDMEIAPFIKEATANRSRRHFRIGRIKLKGK